LSEGRKISNSRKYPVAGLTIPASSLAFTIIFSSYREEIMLECFTLGGGGNRHVPGTEKKQPVAGGVVVQIFLSR